MGIASDEMEPIITAITEEKSPVVWLHRLLPITIDETVVKHIFLVVQSYPHNYIIGDPNIESMSCLVDLENRFVSFEING